MSWSDPCRDCGYHRADCDCKLPERPKLTSKDHYEAALQILKERGVTQVTGHFSPFDDSGYYQSGSNTQIFNAHGNTYIFIFNKYWGNLISLTEL